jgi:putative transposase
MDTDVPQDRENAYRPILASKHQRDFNGFDDKNLSMYARGMTTREIACRGKAKR